MHLARTNGLSPTSEKGQIDADLLREELKDFVSLTTDFCYDSNFDAKQGR